MVASESSTKELIDFGNERKNESYAELETLAYLGCALVGDATDTFMAFLSQIRQLYASSPVESRIHRFIILPSVEAYWRKAIKEARFSFQSPDVVEPLLDTAFASEPRLRVRNIFKALRTGFPSPPVSFASVLRWLDNPKVDEPKKLPQGLQRPDRKASAQKPKKRSRKKTSRNDPCPCGRNKKYKNCCLRR